VLAGTGMALVFAPAANAVLAVGAVAALFVPRLRRAGAVAGAEPSAVVADELDVVAVGV
jgi:cytosine/adenosine deaminase-related metal-dependent hydrolase